MSLQPRHKCLFLFNELAGYLVACLKKLAERPDVEVHVVRWPVNAEAPFKLSFEGSNITMYERKDYTEKQLVELAIRINPDVIMTSGWIDKGYNAVCKHFHGKINTVLGFDNPWRNTLKQNIAGMFGHLWLRNFFSHCWLPGAPQKKYALKLGFREEVIREGIYSCDFDAFHKEYHKNRKSKEQSFPKKIIYVGRYIPLKGVIELWTAFVKFQEEQPSDWELWCLGKGDLEDKIPVHDKIKNIGFVQPHDMHKYISQCGVFILPSHYDNWGVVIHEFAAAGYPLLCSTAPVATSTYLKEGYNGFEIEPYSMESILDAFKKINATSPKDLLLMGDRSAEMAKKYSPATWSDTFMSFIKAN